MLIIISYLAHISVNTKFNVSLHKKKLLLQLIVFENDIRISVFEFWDALEILKTSLTHTHTHKKKNK